MTFYKHEFLTGFLCPINWNEKSEVTRYGLFTENNEDIVLQGYNLHKNFIVFRNKKVKVSGHFLASSSKERIFEVTGTYPARSCA